MSPARVDGSMSLLVDMSEAALDPSYAEAAARKAAGGSAQPVGGRPDRRTTALLIGVLLLVGGVTGVAGAQVRRQADQAGSVRAELLADVRDRTAETDRLAASAEQLREEVAAVQAGVLNEDERGRALAARVAALELATGQTPVEGPGLVVTLDDAPSAGTDIGADRGGQPGDDRIYDRDLQDVVNALWAAGAEAVAVNGQRLTSLTAIRSAGEAVLVDFRPLNPPYRVLAVGDVDRMQPAFADSPTARRFTTYTSLYGLGFSVRRDGKLSLPAAATPQLRSATELAPAPTAAPSSTGTTGPSPGGTP